MRQLPVLSLALAVVTLVGVVVDAYYALANQKLQAEVQVRQQTLNQAIQVGQLTTALAQALAAAAVRADDPDLRAILNDAGITYTVQDNGVPQSLPPKQK